jgi:hypothetical protein
MTAGSAPGQWWDWPNRAGESVAAETGQKLRLHFESRFRYENRTGESFGRAGDLFTGLARHRLGLKYEPADWFSISALMQDARSPWYGPHAPASVRDSADLQEAYFELFPNREGFGMTAGRAMLNYGDTRVLGAPQWGNVARTFDHARIYYRKGGARLELLLLSPVKVRPDDFNKPVLGDRAWGVYNTFPTPWKDGAMEAYILRHDQNRPGGFSGGSRVVGTDSLATQTFGLRVAAPFFFAARLTVEAILQNGRMGAAQQRAGAWASVVSKRWKVAGRTLDISAEYKFASGTRNPQDNSRSGTYDPLYPANHDKYGHADLLGWRNLHNLRSLTTFALSKRFAVNLMYDEFWLASARDALYAGSGKALVQSPDGTAGRHVGREIDLFVTYKAGHWMYGAGYGRFFAGQFIHHTTPGIDPTYAYITHGYSF